MILEFLFVCLLLFAIALISYKSAVHEYEILQRDFSDDVVWSDLLSENLPIVVRNIPKSWIGGWVAVRHVNRPYEIHVRDETGKRLKTTFYSWLQSPKNTTYLETIPDVRLNTSTPISEVGFSRWFYIPHLYTEPRALSNLSVVPLKETIAEYTILVATDGEPITLWLAHEGALTNIDILGKDPWSITSQEYPTIGDVKYIEIRLRPGNAIGIPKHWYYAVKNEGEEASWYYIADLHSPVSWIMSSFVKTRGHFAHP